MEFYDFFTKRFARGLLALKLILNFDSTFKASVWPLKAAGTRRARQAGYHGLTQPSFIALLQTEC